MIEALTVVALVVGIGDTFLSLVLLHRMANDEESERRHNMVMLGLERSQNELIQSIVDRILEDERLLIGAQDVQRPGQDGTKDGEQGDRIAHQDEALERPERAPRWWEPGNDGAEPKLPLPNDFKGGVR